MSKNKYVCLLWSSSGKSCTFPVANIRYRCLINIESPIVTTSTAIFPTLPFLKGRKRQISNKAPKSPQTITARIQDRAKLYPNGEVGKTIRTAIDESIEVGKIALGKYIGEFKGYTTGNKKVLLGREGMICNV